MSNPDDLLLELIFEYKPHSQTYRHRMNTWNELLKVFNNATGASYRQNRTLKTRFEKLKELYIAGEQLPFTNVGLMERILEEDGRDTRSIDSRRPGYRMVATKPSPSPTIQQQEPTPIAMQIFPGNPAPPAQAKAKSYANTELEAASSDEEDQEEQLSNRQPPPLDSITIFPHTQMRRYQEQQEQTGGDFSTTRDSQRFVSSPYIHSQSSSSTNTPSTQFMVTKDNVSSVVNSLKSDFQVENSKDYKSRDLTTMEALQHEVKVMKQNQQVFQRNVLIKLDKITELLSHLKGENLSDFLSLPFAPPPRRDPG
ncbi:LANO_0E04874g1_1 [Lachancea nothofagi CBS 11611]|uniref:LANO_0E04874g1_1 n=1 Tax=Lachancea nothofagi CBS 11611 TaxID=1266666 RepID=A0A1G4JSI8_9SACH|nr:LANO_0E04874g1_1 [Lachancea nothofagi CBS 11611]